MKRVQGLCGAAERTAPTTVYMAGFQPAKVVVDPARFSGSAVNFMEVRKFSDTN